MTNAASTPPASVEVNGVRYAWPQAPVVVVCVDGGDPEYFARARAEGIVPTISRLMDEGFSTNARGTVPSFTNPNNMSIVTGVPPEVHGISGNFYLDRESGEAVMMTGPELLRCETILAAFSRAGAKVAAITAKDKLRAQLGRGLQVGEGAICFSAQHADQCTIATHGIDNVLEYVGLPLPDMYSAELSLFVMEAGAKLLADGRAQILYLSLTDYVQHKHAPGEPEANAFYSALDEAIERLCQLGAVVAITADHGMSDKSTEQGEPNVIWLQDVLDARFGAAATRVICPITDPFVAHHGALGGFVRVYCEQALVASVMALTEEMAGVEAVFDRAGAAREFELPLDREGDVVVVSDVHTCIGAAKEDHDLSGLAGHRLRTHGGIAEANVPFIISHPIDERHRNDVGDLRSHDIFRFAFNGVVTQ
jgi:phosphonoacetate hydrolase